MTAEFHNLLRSRHAKGRATRNWWLTLLRDRCGSSGTEFALVLTPLVLLTFGIIELGRSLYLTNALHYSVEAAARCATVNTTTCGTASQIASYAAAASGAGFASSTFTASTPACGNQVSATYPMNLIIPIGNFSVTLHAKYCFPK